MSIRLKWLLSGGAGALLFGSGFCIALECSHLKAAGDPWPFWVIGGTAGIGSMLAGVVVLIRTAFLEQKMRQAN